MFKLRRRFFASTERVLTPEGFYPLKIGMRVRHPKFGDGKGQGGRGNGRRAEGNGPFPDRRDQTPESLPGPSRDPGMSQVQRSEIQ